MENYTARNVPLLDIDAYAEKAMVVAVDQPAGTVLPELVQWLPVSALDESIGSIGDAALHETTAIVTALVS